ncbi:MAG: hypothetical protein WC369_08240 [Dehalococcoidales bacterium]|jgi:hypothetical protein
MKRRFRWLVISLGLAALLVFSLGAVVLADDPVEGEGDVTTGYCGQGWGANYGFGGSGFQAVGELLSLTTQEIQELRHDGQSLADIAATQGVSEDELVAALIAERQAALGEKVAAGTITQEQADQMLQVMTQNLHRTVNRTTIGQPEDRGACGFGSAGQGSQGYGKGGRQGNGAINGFGMGAMHRSGGSRW